MNPFLKKFQISLSKSILYTAVIMTSWWRFIHWDANSVEGCVRMGAGFIYKLYFPLIFAMNLKRLSKCSLFQKI